MRSVGKKGRPPPGYGTGITEPDVRELQQRPDSAQSPSRFPAAFGQITSLVNVNSNSDKFGADNTGSGLPRQIQFSSRLTFCFSAAR